MNKMNHMPKFLVQLTGGFSTQVKAANRYWLTLAFVSLLTIMPNHMSSESSGNTEVDMPFSLGKVERHDFYPFAVLFISILIVGFGSAQFQAIRSRKLIQTVIKSLNDPSVVYLPGEIYLQDAFDSMISPSVQRVAPIAQILQGRFQFFPKSLNCPKFRTLVCALYYVLLKLVSALVVYIFPAYALTNSFLAGGLGSLGAHPWKIPVVFFWIAALMAMGILLQLFICDLLYMSGALRRIWARSTD